MYLLDTDISLFAIKGHQVVLKRLAQIVNGPWGISVLTRYEIEKGIQANPTSRSSAKAKAYLNEVVTLDFGAEASSQAAWVYQTLRVRGITIGMADELIAAHALSLKATLVTNNLRHFENVPGLKLESWI